MNPLLDLDESTADSDVTLVPGDSVAKGSEGFLENYLMIILVGVVLLYVVVHRVLTARSGKPSLHKPHISDEQRLAGMRAARERQQAYMDECTKRDETLREQRRTEEQEEREKHLFASRNVARTNSDEFS